MFAGRGVLAGCVQWGPAPRGRAVRHESVLCFLAVTVEGKVYACGEATNGRLGLGLSSGTVPIPRQITALSSYVVKKVAVHSGTDSPGPCPRAVGPRNAVPEATWAWPHVGLRNNSLGSPQVGWK